MCICSVQFSSVTQSCPILCNPMNHSTPASLSITNPQSPPKSMSIGMVMPSNHLILCHPLLLLPSIFPSIRVFSNESVLLTLMKTLRGIHRIIVPILQMRKLRLREVIRPVPCSAAGRSQVWCHSWPMSMSSVCHFRSWLMPVILEFSTKYRWPATLKSILFMQEPKYIHLHISQSLLRPTRSWGFWKTPERFSSISHDSFHQTDGKYQGKHFKFRNTNKHTEYFPKFLSYKHQYEGFEPNGKWKIDTGEGGSE